MNKQLYFVRQLFMRLGIVWLVYTLLRLLFFFFNRDTFPDFTFVQTLPAFMYGIRYDFSAIVYFNFLFILLHLLPLPWRSHRIYQGILKWIFYLINGFAILIAVSDLVYFQFNRKRISSDVISMMGSFRTQIPQFMKDFWYLFLLFALIMWGMERLYRRSSRPQQAVPLHFVWQISLFLLVSGLMVLAARGGFQKIPITPVQAMRDTDPRLSALVLNSPYTFLYSFQKRKLELKNYMSADDCKREFTIQKTVQASDSMNRMNVVVLILESFAREFVGSMNGYTGYTPFMDSLVSRSFVCTNAFASAERSNKALPAILAGIPSLMDDPFINSAYQSNRICGLGTILKTKGYQTSFFHGGINGEFNFDSFSGAAGFEKYYGRNEFHDERFFDGHWGIYDEEFLQYFAGKLNEFSQPFCTALFTVTSHHPFTLPAKYKGKFPTGDNEIHESIGYADFALRKFFETASTQNWYKNTLFVICADHTFQYGKRLAPRYENRAGYFSIPILFFTPGKEWRGRYDHVFQQTDLVPSILEQLNYSGTIYSFGSSFLSDTVSRVAVQYLDHVYQMEDDRFCLLYDGTRAIGLYEYLIDHHFDHNLLEAAPDQTAAMQKKLEAIIQTYNASMNANTLCRN